MIKTDIRNLSYQELEEVIQSFGEKSFRAGQIFDWVYQKGVDDFSLMRNISDSFRKKLSAQLVFEMPTIINQVESSDGTLKVLFQLKSGEKIETVLIPTEKRVTVCVSTQVGCKFGCRFCASGIGGWKRNLSVAEILSQILVMQAMHKEKKISHVVFMGGGEPFDNYDNLLKAIRIINDRKALGIGARRITVSTCGVIPQIKQLVQEGLQIELAISLHGYDHESRNLLMPVNKKYPFEELLKTCREFNKLTKRQITFEYILIKEVTCTQEAAIKLGLALKGLICKMNLISYNPVTEFDFQSPTRKEISVFQNQLKRNGIHSTVRASRGEDVSAACGQLRHTVS